MANIRDVAKHAGVSIATVSATLNDSGPVSEETRRRVWAAVEAVGYSPNAIARSLRLGKSRLIGIVVGDITNPFCAAVVRAIEEVAIAAKYSIIVCTAGDDEARELEVLDQLRAQHVAGIILMPGGSSEAYVRRLDRHGMPPIVTMDQKVGGLARDFVGVDNRAAVRMITEYLLRLGHRRIAMIKGRAGTWTAEERLAAFEETMREAGAEVDASLLVDGNYQGDAAYAATMPLLTRPDRPTAILAANNVMGLGALQAIIDVGFRCPADISIAAIDDVPWSGLVRPRVVTVAQPIEEISRIAIRWLLERMAGDHSAPRNMVFGPKFISGDSCSAVGQSPHRRDARPETIPA